MDDWKICENIAIDTYENMNNLFVRMNTHY